MGADREVAHPVNRASLWQRLELRTRSASAHSTEAGGTILEPGSRIRDAEPGLWPVVGARVAAAHPCPRLRAGLAIKPLPAALAPHLPRTCPEGRDSTQGGVAGALLADPAGGRIFRLGEREAAILSLLDGKLDAPAIAQALAPRFGSIPVPAVDQLVQDLALAGLLDERVGLWQRLAAPGKGRQGSPIILWSANGEKVLPTWARRLRGLCPGHPVAWVVVGALLLAAIALVVVRWPIAAEGALAVSTAALAADPWPRLALLVAGAYLLMIPAVLLHEVAHALACVYHGGRVTRLGLMMRHLLPAAFADISDVYFLPKGARIAVYLAGPASTLMWAALAAMAWAALPAGSFGQMLAGAVAILAALAMLVGLNPVAGYDGTEALAEWLGMPGLHRRALAYWGDRLRGPLGYCPFPRTLSLPSDTVPRDKCGTSAGQVRLPERAPGHRVLSVYGLAALFYYAATALIGAALLVALALTILP